MSLSRFDVARARHVEDGIDNPAMEIDSTAPERPEICHLTLEALPREDYYKNNKDAVKRPSLGELHGEPRTQEPVGHHLVSHFNISVVRNISYTIMFCFR